MDDNMLQVSIVGLPGTSRVAVTMPSLPEYTVGQEMVCKIVEIRREVIETESDPHPPPVNTGGDGA